MLVIRTFASSVFPISHISTDVQAHGHTYTLQGGGSSVCVCVHATCA